MRKKPKDALVFNGNQPGKDMTLFNGQLLDQQREDVFVLLHQLVIR